MNNVKCILYINKIKFSFSLHSPTSTLTPILTPKAQDEFESSKSRVK